MNDAFRQSQNLSNELFLSSKIIHIPCILLLNIKIYRLKKFIIFDKNKQTYPKKRKKNIHSKSLQINRKFHDILYMSSKTLKNKSFRGNLNDGNCVKRDINSFKLNFSRCSNN